jgi:hypothetical protein
MLCQRCKNTLISAAVQEDWPQDMLAKALKILRNIHQPAVSFGRTNGARRWIKRALVWLARPRWQRWRIERARNRRALAQLADDQLSNLSEIGRQVRRDARRRARESNNLLSSIGFHKVKI